MWAVSTWSCAAAMIPSLIAIHLTSKEIESLNVIVCLPPPAPLTFRNNPGATRRSFVAFFCLLLFDLQKMLLLI